MHGYTKIIALINRKNEAFLFRTRSVRPSTVIRRHLRGEHDLTREHFAKEGIRRPNVYLLAVLDSSYYDSYKYLLAYLCILRDAGYTLVNHLNTLENAQNLHPETKNIYDELRRESIGALLIRTKLQKYTDADDAQRREKRKAAIRKDHKLTIRVTKADRDRFVAYAEKLKLSQGDALSVLLTKYENNFESFVDWDNDYYVGQILESARDQVNLMRAQLDIKQELWGKERKQYQARIETLRQRLVRIQKGLCEYYRFFKSSCNIPLGIDTDNYRQYTRNLNDRYQYAYPSQEGWCLMRPVAILYGAGRTPVRFLLGTTTDGRDIKLRIYPKEYFAGVSLRNESYGLRGSVWLVAWEKAHDEAMDLVMALPLDIQPRYNIPWNQTNDFTRFMADLDEELAESGDKQ